MKRIVKVKKIIMLVLVFMLVSNMNVRAENLDLSNIKLLDESSELSKEYAAKNNRLLYEEDSFVETSIHYVNNEVVEVKERNITESEYDNSIIETRTKCDFANADDCWETASKRVTIAAWKVGSSSCPSYRIQIDNVWKKIPNVKSFDVIALRYNDKFSAHGAIAHQTYKIDGVEHDITYSPDGTNTKRFSNGIGVSMNIVDAVTSDLHLSLLVEGTASSGVIGFGGTYQHATSNVTLTQSQNYTISTSDLGGILAFNSSVIGKYDGMQGVGGLFHSTGCIVR